MNPLFHPSVPPVLPISGEGDRLTGMVEPCLGVTEHTRLLAELLESRRFLRSTLDALSSHIAILDEPGTILEVNAAWQNFARENQLCGSSGSVGANYLTVCDAAAGPSAEGAAAVAAGIRAVIAGQTEFFQQEYACHGAGEQRWFVVRVTRFADHGPIRVVVAHQRVTERKLAEIELARTHARLLETARLAGMAEVATSVLHNVGNVLNSINVATNCLTDRIKKSRAGNLTRVAALLQAHQTELGSFFTSDAKGQQIPAYLTQLGEHLTREQATMLQELADLQKSVDHIKEIVVAQQGYAKMSGASESLSATDLVEGALKLNSSCLLQYDIKIIKDFEPVPLVAAIKHQALQILVNLVRNAAQAYDGSNCPDRQVRLRVTPTPEFVQISVSDKGSGILPENLTQIFTHGFTTKKDGHGFGLHSCALAAKAMKGSLLVQSDGPGTGATFMLELPCVR